MTIKAMFHQDGSYTGLNLRRAIDVVGSGRDGIVGYGEYAGAAVSTTSFRIQPGYAIVTHRLGAATGGRFLIHSDATFDVTGLTAPGSNKYRYLVYLKLNDNNLDGGTSAATLTYVRSAAEASPALPTPSGESYLPLYDITIPFGSTLTSGSQVIVDLRQYTKSWFDSWGLMGTVADPSRDSPWGAEADWPGLAVSFTAVSNRYYRAEARVSNYQSVQAGINTNGLTFRIRDDSNVVRACTDNESFSGSTNISQGVMFSARPFTLTGGTRTLRVTAGASYGQGTVNIYAGQDNVAFLAVYDIGPA